MSRRQIIAKALYIIGSLCFLAGTLIGCARNFSEEAAQAEKTCAAVDHHAIVYGYNAGGQPFINCDIPEKK